MSKERELLQKASLMLKGVQLLDGVGNSNCGGLAKEIDTELEKHDPEILFQSSCSGVWYKNINSAGDIMAVKINDVLFYPQQPSHEKLSD